MKRSLLLAAVWVVAAAAAVGVGFLAVSLVDASASPATQPAADTTAATPTGTAIGTAAPPPPVAPSGEQATAGGTVFASCVDGGVQLAAAPAAGWEVETYVDHVEFESATQKVEVYADCATGSPRFLVEGPRSDDNGRSDDSVSSSSSASSAPPAAPSVDDNGGDRGGHGSDDPPGDDHGGDSGGGHGSDD
jgi:hypothetical protein